VALNFAVVGVAGYVASRHLKAVVETDNKIVAALDPHDSVGILDRFGRDIDFFVEPERFERHLRALQRTFRPVDWLSVCSPNHLHDVHTALGLHSGANVICEKPLVLSPWNLDALAKDEQETGKRVYTVLQLRRHPQLMALKAKLDADPRDRQVKLIYHTPRGRWYFRSWKGDVERSGGLLMNIGIHLFDLLLWLFGPVVYATLEQNEPGHARGELALKRAGVTWELSVDADEPKRELLVDGTPVSFDDGFADLHTDVYRETLAGRGFGIEDARPSVELVYSLRHLTPVITS
jgi:UDP-N-acetyl-2-amino-2-deoxyglucuronate dehydrogenase